MVYGSDDLVVVKDCPEGISHVRVLTINRPEKRNAIDVLTGESLARCLDDSDKNPNVKAIIVTGQGSDAFCAGADLSGLASLDESSMAEMTKLFGDLFCQVRFMGTPLIAAVNGIAVGGGFGLLLSSDIAVASNGARIGTPEVKRGLFPALISRMIYEQLPSKFANELIMLGEVLSPSRAMELGLINHVVPSDQVMAKSLDIASKIASFSGEVMNLVKTAVSKQKDMAFKDAIGFLQGELSRNIALPDTREGILAFIEKRKPKW